MTEQKSLCLRCRSYMYFRYNTVDLQEKPAIWIASKCKKGLYEHCIDGNPDVISCTEFKKVNQK